MFASWGRTVHRHRKATLAVSALLLVVSLLVARGGTLITYPLPEGTESAEVSDLMEAQLAEGGAATFILVLSHPDLTWGDAHFRDAAQSALAPLRDDARVASVRTPYDGGAARGDLVSVDGRRVAALVTLRDDAPTARDYFPDLRGKVASDTLDVKATGPIAVYSDIETALAEDLQKAEVAALPLTLILLLLVFGSVVAALLPLGVGALAVVGGLGGVYLASNVTDISVYAVNIVTLIGLGVAIDYSLFIVNRFREELARGRDGESALGETMATAGRAVAFSGLTVAVGLAGLLFYRGLFFSSIGLAGAIVVGLAVLYALTFLPALLAVLGPRVDKWRMPVPRLVKRPFWGPLARGVMRRPLLVLLPILGILLVAGMPFLQLEMAGASVDALPEHAESRAAADVLARSFPGIAENVALVVVDYGSGDPLTRTRVGDLYDYSRALAAVPGVQKVTSVVDLRQGMTKGDYQDLYAQPRSRLPGGIQDAVNASVGDTIVLLRVESRLDETGQASRDMVEAIRALPPPTGARALVGGTTAFDIDTLDLVYRHTPAAIAFVVVTTYVLLLAQTGSVVLPAKAILMNFLSITASFGAIVWVFQWGNLSDVLAFTPAPLDPSLPILLFCTVFGLSMDYEVLLLSRMHEEYERTGDNAQAVAAGLEKTGRLITSAAAIMIVVFGAFALASVTLIKAIGIGLALAIAVDATLVRALVVPAAMRLMGRWNWWAPKPIEDLWRLLG
jgi:RND superfamily putative drug exporter